MGYHRLGNVLVPLETYGPAIEKRLQPWLERKYQEGTRSMTTEQLCFELGELGDEHSILYWARKKKVPIFVPGPMDGAVGSQIWLFANRRSDFRVDVIGDEKRLADITFDSKKSGALVIGGGISQAPSCCGGPSSREALTTPATSRQRLNTTAASAAPRSRRPFPGAR